MPANRFFRDGGHPKGHPERYDYAEGSPDGIDPFPDSNRGDTISLNTTATGKVLAAFSGEIENLLNRMDYVKLTKRSVTDRDEFAELLQEVRAQRLAYDMEEVTEGLVCVATPVLAKDGIAICSISINGYKERMIRSLDSIIMRLQDCARECEKLLQ